MSSYPIVMVSKMVPTPSRRAYGGVNLRGLSGQQIEHVRANLPFLMNGIVQFAFGPSSPGIRGADRISEATVESEPRTENFPCEKECQSIILAFAKEFYNYSIKDRNRLSRICRLRECRLHRDTVAKLLRESDPSIQKFQAPPNREKSYHTLIFAFASQHCRCSEDGPSEKAAVQIAKMTEKHGDPVALEVVREILKTAAALVASQRAKAS